MPTKLISIIVPAHDEAENVPLLYRSLQETIEPLRQRYAFEIIFVDDGSRDGTLEAIRRLAETDDEVRYLSFSRNFGKELATTAGLNHCHGDAAVMIDADLQHPVRLIPEFVRKWEEGSEVVVGVRNESKSSSALKRSGSRLFYLVINRIADIKLVPNVTDFRLVARNVIDEFNRFSEKRRLTRALIDWLGFSHTYIRFDADERRHGRSSYSLWKLTGLAISSFVSLSMFPLRLVGYLGIFITSVSLISGTYIFFGKYFFGWNFASTFSDAENLAIFIVFLVGIILMSIGLLSLYIADIHGEVVRRPLYVIRRKNL